MREILDFFLNDEGTKYQLRAEMREAGMFFSLSVRNELGSLYESGEAYERDGDLESYDDGDGESHLVRLYKYRSRDCKMNIAIEISDSKYAWIVYAESADELEGLRYTTALPLDRVYG